MFLNRVNNTVTMYKKGKSMKNLLTKKNLTKALCALAAVGLLSGGAVQLLTRNVSASPSAISDGKAVPGSLDAISAINYATILGRATDFGIVANDFEQAGHMETTYAVNTFTNKSGEVNEVDFINNTAQFMIGSMTDGSQIMFGSRQTAVAYNIETTSTVINGFNPSAWDSLTEPEFNANSSNFYFDNASQAWVNSDGSIHRPVNTIVKSEDAINANINDTIGNTVVSSDYIHDRATNPLYALDYSQYLTIGTINDPEYDPNDQNTGDINNGNRFFINIDYEEYKNRVVYINVDDNLARVLGNNQGVCLIKDPSTVVVFNIEPGITNIEDSNVLSLNMICVSEDGGKNFCTSDTASLGNSSESHSNSSLGTENTISFYNSDVDSMINQKIIFNIRSTTTNVDLKAIGGTVLLPNSTTSTTVSGSSTGWIVSGGHLKNTGAEWHYIYQGGSQELINTTTTDQIHFALHKGFTADHAVTQANETITPDNTVYIEQGDYSFNLYDLTNQDRSHQTFSDINLSSTSGLSPVKTASNQATGNVQFESITLNNPGDYYYIISEANAGTTSGSITNADGYIKIHVQVIDAEPTNTYVVDYEYYMHSTDTVAARSRSGLTMMGVQFDLEGFYNFSSTTPDSTNLIINKTLHGETDLSQLGDITFDISPAANGVNSVTLNAANASDWHKDGDTYSYVISNVTVGTYTVSESSDGSNSDYSCSVAPAGSSITMDISATETLMYSFDNYYTPITPNTGSVEFCKVDPNGNPINNCTFELTSSDVSDLTVVDVLASSVTGNPTITADKITVKTAMGNVSFSELPVGHYTLTETANPAGYVDPDRSTRITSASFTVSADGTVTNNTDGIAFVNGVYTFINDTESTNEYTIAIDKLERNAQGQTSPYSGVTFQLEYYSNDNNSLAWYPTSNISNATGVFVSGSRISFRITNGPVTFRNLPDGTYIVSEISVPDSTHNSVSAVSFSVSGGRVSVNNTTNRNDISFDSSTQTLSIIDDIVQGTLRYSKVVAENTPEECTAGTYSSNNIYEFTIYRVDGTELSLVRRRTVYLGDNYSETNLPAGRYLILENRSVANRTGDYTLTLSSNVGTPHYDADGNIDGFYVDIGTTPGETVNFVMTNTYTPVSNVLTNVHFRKVDNDNKYVDGAVVELTGVDNQGAVVFTTTQVTGATDVALSASGTKLTFTIDGDNCYINDLPDGTYTFHEVTAPADYAFADDITITVSGGQITGGPYGNVNMSTNTVTMVDDYAGTLTIDKVLTGNDASTESFSISVAFGSTVTYTVGGTVYTDTGRTFDLAAGESITIANIPAGTEYTVTETLTSAQRAAGYSLTGITNNGQGAIVAEADTAITVTNNYTVPTGILEVTKVVNGSNESTYDADTVYEVNVTLDVTGTYAVSVAGRNAQNVSFTAGTPVSFELKANETVVIRGVPENAGYEVTETALSQTLIDAGYAAGNITPSTGTIDAGNTDAVTVNNSYTPVYTTDVDINKVIAGGTTHLEGATLTITTETDGVTFIGCTVEGPATDVSVTDTEISFKTGDDVATIRGLKDGVYVLTENAAPTVNGVQYNIATPIRFTITNGVVQPGTGVTVATGSNNAVVTMEDAVATNELTFTKTFGGDVTEAEASGATTLYFVIKNTDTNQYLKADGTFTSNEADAHIYLSDLDHTAGTMEWGKTYTVPCGNYEVTETNTDIHIAGSSESYTFSSTSVIDDSTEVSKTTAGSLELTNIYNTPSPTTGELTFTKTFGGDVTESEAAGDDLFFVIQNTTTGEFLKADGTFTSNSDEAHITLAQLNHTAGTKVWSKTFTVPAGEYVVTETNEAIYINGLQPQQEYTFSHGANETTSGDLTAGGALALSMTNIYETPTNDLVITKTLAGETDPASLGGIVFTISPTANATSSVTLDANYAATGWVKSGNTYTYTISDVKVGTYTVTESVNGSNSSYTCVTTPATSASATVTTTAAGSAAFTNTYTSTNGTLTFTKTFGGDVTETEIANDDLYFVITRTDVTPNQYLKADGTFTTNIDEAHITISQLTKSAGSLVYSKTFTVPAGTYTVTETNEEIYINGTTPAQTYTFSHGANENISGDLAGGGSLALALTNVYDTPAPTDGTLTFTKTFGGDVTEAEAAGDDLFFVIQNTTTGEYLKADGTFTSNSDEAHITLAQLNHTAGTKVWSKTFTVPAGNYEVTETNEAIYINGVQPQQEYTFSHGANETTSGALTAGNTLALSMTNIYETPTNDLVITKTLAGDETDLASLGGIVFTISPSANSIATVTLDANYAATGWVKTGDTYTYTISDVKVGTYTVSESVNGSNTSYTCVTTSATSADATVTETAAGSVAFTNTYTAPKGDLTFTKTFGGDVTETEASGDDLYFVIQNTTTGEYLKADGTTTTNEAEAHITLASSCFTHTAGTMVWTASFSNVAAGAYEVTETNEAIYISGTTPAKTYTFSHGADDTTTGTLTDGNTLTLSMTNNYATPTVETGTLTFTKTFGGAVTETEAAGDDLYFVVQNTTTGEYLKADGTFTTNIDEAHITLAQLNHTDGTMEWSKTFTVPVGSYEVSETNEAIYISGSNPAQTYTFSHGANETISGDLTANDSLALSLTNVYDRPAVPATDVDFSKVDTNNVEIEGAQITLTGVTTGGSAVTFSESQFQGGANSSHTPITDGDTAIYFISGSTPSRFVGLPDGTYTLEETVAPSHPDAGYYYVTTTISFTVDNGTVTVSGTDARIDNSGSTPLVVMVDNALPVPSSGCTLNLAKVVNANGASVPSSYVFNVKSGDTYYGLDDQGNVVTDANPIAITVTPGTTVSLTGLPAGDYQVTEVRDGISVSGYTLSVTGERTVSLDDDATTATPDSETVTVVNTYSQMLGTLTIEKVLGAGAPASASSLDYQFTVTAPDGTSQIVTITGAGTATLTDLVPGQYTITENATSAAIGGYQWTATGNGSVTVDVVGGQTSTVTITNDYEATTAPTQPTTPSSSETTPSSSETTPSSSVSETTTTTTTTTTEVTTTTTVFVSAMDVEISKQDIAGAEIDGAVLTITNAAGTTTNFLTAGVTVTQNGLPASGLGVAADKVTFTTVASSSALIHGLPVGRYVLTETIAPRGFLIAESINFEVRNDGTIWVEGTPQDQLVERVVMQDLADPRAGDTATPTPTPASVSSLLIDGKEISSDNYTVNSDNTVTVNEEFARTLGAGRHRVVITMDDGSTRTLILTVNEDGSVVTTGESKISTSALLAVVMFAASGFVFVVRKKSVRDEEN